MLKDNKVLLGKSGDEEIVLYPSMANRHGLIAGATGTGKTVTLKVLAEAFSKMGVPVFLADVKGDLAPMCKKGTDNENVTSRVESMGLAREGFEYSAFPVNFWDVYGEGGMPLRTTVSEMGPVLLARIMGLNETQTDVLSIIFKIADDEGLVLVDIKDLKAVLRYVGEHAAEYSAEYGNMAKVTLNAIVRAVVALEADGGELFFGEPGLTVTDWLCTDEEGHGIVQILDCRKLILHPKMYSTFLLWMMSELFELLPEVGDLEKPRMVFFFDEAHMLFESASKALMEKIVQVVKLIRSKGVGIFFITQSPSDVPDSVLSQLGNKIQHALRAYTPKEQKAVKAAADSFRTNPDFDTYRMLTELGTGKALVSVIDESGIPTVVKHTKICPPESFMGTLDETERLSIINNCVLNEKYMTPEDRFSAYEYLARREQEAGEEARKEQEALLASKKKEKEIAARDKAKRKAAKNVANTAGGTIGRELGKTLGAALGGRFGKTLGGNLGASFGRGLFGTLFDATEKESD
jgi:DNA helicase HerA-like ATPase